MNRLAPLPWLLLSLILALALAAPVAHGCAGNPSIPPSSFCWPLKDRVLSMPEPYFHRELSRLLELPNSPVRNPGIRDHYWLEEEKEKSSGVVKGPWERTIDAEAQDLETALRAAGRDAAAITNLVARLRAVRTVTKVEYGEDETTFNAEAAAALQAELPREFSLYLQGAAAWHAGDAAHAIESWRAMLALPASERHYRSVWAAYKIGLALMAQDPEGARQAFEQCRALAAAGFADTLGLASSSLGWQAKLEYDSKRWGRALRLYLEQSHLPRADGPDYVSIVWACARVTADTSLTMQLARDPLCRPALTAFILARGFISDPDNLWESMDRETEMTRVNSKRWLNVIQSAGVSLTAPESEDLAWMAYNQGEMDQARQWLAMTPNPQPIGRWLRAKLMLHAGQIEPAIAELESLRKVFSPNDIWGISGESVLGTVAPYRSVCAELGAIYLGQEKYMQALEAYVGSGQWSDIAYLAERVMTSDEVEAYLTTHADHPDLAAENISRYSRGSIGTELRYLLARRLVREGKLDRARPYFAAAAQSVSGSHDRYDESNLVALTELFDDLFAARHAADDPALGLRARAERLIEAGTITREWGMELMGTELDPDWTICGGDFTDDDPAAIRAFGQVPSWRPEGWRAPSNAAELENVLAVKPSEKERLARTVAEPNARFHYRLRASDLAWRAALMLPRNDLLGAEAMWYAQRYSRGDWNTRRRTFYAYALRNSKIPAGAHAYDHGAMPYEPPQPTPAPVEDARFYVNAVTGDDERDGRSWAAAKRTIDVAADAAADVVAAGGRATIWVARGTYRERLTLRSGVAILGGFAGDETTTAQRRLSLLDPSRIDASQADGGRPADHAVIANGVTTATLDGFVIQGGRADGADLAAHGGGLYFENVDTSVRVSHCLVTGNRANLRGGGIYCRNASPVLTACTLACNIAADGGGGLACERGSSPALHNCTLVDNSAAYGDGAGLLCEDSSPTLTASRIAGNWTGAGDGGGLALRSSSPHLNNCLISGNAAGDDGGVLSVEEDSHPALTFCTITDNFAGGNSGGIRLGGDEGTYYNTNFSAVLSDCIITGNNRLALSAGSVVPVRCLFDGNVDGIYPALAQDAVAVTEQPAWRTASEVNAHVPGASGNVGGDPSYVMNGPEAYGGTWSDDPVYDRATNTTRLVDRWALFGRQFHGGELIRTNLARRTVACVLGAADRKTLVVAGDLTRRVRKGDRYLLIDYRLRNGSAGLKRSPGTGTPTDLYGIPRPAGMADLGAFQSPLSYRPAADHEPTE